MEGRVLKETLKPTTGKVAMFVILVFLIVILPLYPTHYAVEDVVNPGVINESSGITLMPIYFVIKDDFEWSEIKEHPDNIFLGAIEYTNYDYSANPVFLILYIPYAIIAYILGCFLAEYLTWWKNKNKNNKGIKDL